MTRLLQDEGELAAFTALLAAEGVRSYLEVGSMFGVCLGLVAAALPVGSRVVSVDRPGSVTAGQALHRNVRLIASAGYDAHMILGDSASPKTIDNARRLGPFDAILIDADHTRAGVEADWRNYGPMARIVAFHDIAWCRAPEWKGIRIDVPEFWNEIKGSYRHQEFKFCPTGKNNGIGVLWRQ